MAHAVAPPRHRAHDIRHDVNSADLPTGKVGVAYPDLFINQGCRTGRCNLAL
jgi:hypothetical protein